MTVKRFQYLLDFLLEASEKVPQVEQRRMFGCDALFTSGTIYGLIWKTGRIGLKIPDPESFQALMAMDGSEPWTAGNKTMSHWVLVPETFHDDHELLQTWTEKAASLVTQAPSRSKSRKKKTTTKTKAKTKSKAKT